MGELTRSLQRPPDTSKSLEFGAHLRRLKLDHPDDESTRVSHEAIYLSLFVQSRGQLDTAEVPAFSPGSPP